MKENTKEYWNDECESCEKCEKVSPEKILNNYGNYLTKQNNNLLIYKTKTNSYNIGKIYNNIHFYCGIPKNDFKFQFELFEIKHLINKNYPCVLYDMLNDETIECENLENFKENIEKQMETKKISNALSGLIYHFYGDKK